MRKRRMCEREYIWFTNIPKIAYARKDSVVRVEQRVENISCPYKFNQ